MKKIRGNTLGDITQKFKNNIILGIKSKIAKKTIKLKRFFNLIKGKTKEWITKRFEVKELLDGFAIWLIEVTLEGLGVNFALYILLDYPITIWTPIAYGICIERMINIFWRLKQNGSTKKLH